jgi:hypothetical protein
MSPLPTYHSPALSFHTPLLTPAHGDTPTPYFTPLNLQRNTGLTHKMALIQLALKISLNKSTQALKRLDERTQKNPVLTMSLGIVGALVGGTLLVLQPIAGAAVLSASGYMISRSLKPTIQHLKHLKSHLQALSIEAKEEPGAISAWANAETAAQLPTLNELLLDLNCLGPETRTAEDVWNVLTVLDALSPKLIKNIAKNPKGQATLNNHVLGLKALCANHPASWKAYPFNLHVSEYLKTQNLAAPPQAASSSSNRPDELV